MVDILSNVLAFIEKENVQKIEIQSTLSKIYWGIPVNLSKSYRESISYNFVYTMGNICMFIYIPYTHYMYT